MNIVLYKNTAENIRIDKSNYLTDILNLSGTLRKSSNILNPTFEVQSTELITSNYCYIEEFNRYYFITDIVSVRNGLFRITCTVDVLMTYKDYFLNETAMIGRGTLSSNVGKDIVDPLLPFKSNMNIDNTLIENVGLVTGGLVGSFVCIIALIGQNVTSDISATPFDGYYSTTPDGQYSGLNRTYKYYAIINDEANLDIILREIMGKSEYASFVGGIWLYPIRKDYIRNLSDSQIVEEISFGYNDNYTIGAGSENSVYLLNQSNSIEWTSDDFVFNRKFNDFRDYEPYSIYEIFIPYYGFVGISSYHILNKTLRFKYLVDATNGSCRVVITSNDFKVPNNTDTRTIVTSVEFKLGQSIPVNYTNFSDVERNSLTNKISLTTGIIGSVIQAGAGAASVGMGLAAEATQFVANASIDPITGMSNTLAQSNGGYVRTGANGLTGIVNSVGSYLANEVKNVERGVVIQSGESYLSYMTPNALILRVTSAEANIDIDTFNSLLGREIKSIMNISDLDNGFFTVDEIFLKMPTATISEIKSLYDHLRSGVIK